MPAKKTEAQKAVETTAKTIEDTAVKAQKQYLAALEQTQTLALEAYGAWIDALKKIELPSVLGLEIPEALIPDMDAVKVPADVFDGIFDFGAAVLENQKQFASKMLAATKA